MFLAKYADTSLCVIKYKGRLHINVNIHTVLIFTDISLTRTLNHCVLVQITWN